MLEPSAMVTVAFSRMGTSVAIGLFFFYAEGLSEYAPNVPVAGMLKC